MSSVSNKLGLTLPEITDEVGQTIQDLNRNFEILDDAFDPHVESIPTSGYWLRSKRCYFANPVSGDYLGIVNLREGQAAPKWSGVHSVTVGDFIVPTEDNGHVYKCIQTGYSSFKEPLWTTSSNSQIEDTRDKSTWAPSKFYGLNEIIVPSINNGRFYICTTAGTSGTTEPNWSTIDGTTTGDGSLVWTTYKIAKWQEAGVACLFKRFGLIE